MSVIYLSGDAINADDAQCSICRKYLPLSQLSVGMCDTQNNQTFLCDAHYTDLPTLIVGWADYMVAERQRQIIDMELFMELYGG